MRRGLFSLMLLFLSATALYGSYDQHSDWGLGIKAEGKIPSDFRLGLVLNTPYLLDQRLAGITELSIGLVRGTVVSGTSTTNQYYYSYGSIKAGLRVCVSFASPFIRPYADFGYYGILIGNAFSSTPWSSGIFMALGADFLFRPDLPGAFFAECSACAILSGGIADRMLNSPSFGGEYYLSAGYRFYW